MSARRGFAILTVLAISLVANAAPQQPQEQNVPPGADHLHLPDGETTQKLAQGVMESMSSEHMHMDAHMRWTQPRSQTPEDVRRADDIVKTLRASIEKYKDYRVAMADGYRIFLPNIPQPMYHFTNYRIGYEAETRFDSSRPTSLLYKKSADGYELIGAMYTASRFTAEDELNGRVPLGVARWHAHINICLPPRIPGQLPDLTKFGPRGTIATQAECEAAGGRFLNQIFGWMVHVYPFEETPEKIWRH